MDSDLQHNTPWWRYCEDTPSFRGICGKSDFRPGRRNNGLRDTVKAISEELELKPALINKAISIAHKDNYKNLTDDLDTLESILVAAGKL